MLRPICALLLLFAAVAHAQVKPVPAPSPAAPTDAFVNERTDVRTDFDSDGRSKTETAMRIRINSEAALQNLGILTFYYQNATQKLNIDYVRVVKPDGSIIVTDPDTFQDVASEISRLAPTYSDLREKHVAVKGLSVGDAIEYKTTVQVVEPLVPGQFWDSWTFDTGSVHLADTLTVSVPRDRAVNVKSTKIKPTVSEDGSRRVYTWKFTNPEAVPEEDRPYVHVGLQPPPDVEMSSFHSWDEVAGWYASLQHDRIAPTPEIKTRALALTKDAKTDDEKVEALYSFVAMKFRYIGVSFGIGRYQPHAASTVLDNGFGDCKDKHTLLAALLAAIGIESDPLLISTESQLDPDVPSPAQFNHVISRVKVGSSTMFLDTTTEAAPFGYLIRPLRNKQALLVRNDGKGEIIRTPPTSPVASLVEFHMNAELNASGVLQGEAQQHSRGDVEVQLRNAFRLTPMPQWKDLVQRLSYGEGFGGTVSEVKVSNTDEIEKPFEFSYHYDRKDYSDWKEHQITPPLPPVPLPLFTEEDEAKHKHDPIEFNTGEWHFSADLKLPSGYSGDIPKRVDEVRDFAEYHATYSFKDGVLHVDRRLVVKAPEIAAAQRSTYKTFREKISDDETHYIYLAAAGESEDAMPGRTGNAGADALYSDFVDAFKARDMTLAQEKLDLLKRMDPKYPALWLGYAYLHFTDREQAVSDLRKEISLHPREVQAYKMLASYYQRFGQTNEAMQIWRDLLKVMPDDMDALRSLASMLIADDQPEDAIALLEGPYESNQQSNDLTGLLASAYLHAHQPTKALPLFERTLKQNDVPGMYNNAAYVLADANTELPTALKWAQHAMEGELADLNKIKLADLDMDQLHSVGLLGATWDTVGWIYFRMGDFVKAERYTKAAWDLTQLPETAYHLGDIYAAQHKKQAAGRMYATACLLTPGLPKGVGVRVLPKGINFAARNKHDAAIYDKLKAIAGSASAADDLIRSVTEVPSRERTVTIPRIAKVASGEVFLLVDSDGHISDTRFVGGSQELSRLGDKLASVKLPVTAPDASPFKLVRRGIVMCPAAKGDACDLVLLNPNDVKSIE
jgi:transglutaminase-like putative cysteine protease/tetratricopeptide (TPR) repeat protein